MKVLELIETIARERCIEQKTVLDVMESILLEMVREKFGNEDIQAKLFDDGSFEVFLNQEVVPDEEDDETNFSTISLSKAIARNPKIEIGNIIKEVLPLSIGQSDAEKIFTALKTKLNEAQRAKEYAAFVQYVDTIMVGYIKRVDASEAVITFPEGEGVLRRNDMLPNDMLRAGNYVKVYVKEVRQSAGRQIFLSRTADGFLRELLKAEVPEIQDKLVEIKAIARDVGSLSKVAVVSIRPSINPISVCIGPYGSRIQAVTKELMGEKISIVEWSSNLQQFIANALSPAIVSKIIEKADGRFDVVTVQEQFSKAMGRGGQNVVLAKKLCGVHSIKLLTEEEHAREYQAKLAEQSRELINNLEIEEMMAHLLIAEKLDNIWKIAKAPLDRLESLDGFDIDLAQALQERAIDFIETDIKQVKAQLEESGKDVSIFEISSLQLPHIKHLIRQNIFEKRDVAMLDVMELKDVFEENHELSITYEMAHDIVASARNIASKNAA